MATFEVLIHSIKIEPHPDADALELAVVGDYRAIVGKGLYKNGDKVAYIPEGAIIPDWLIDKLGLTGKLAGSKKNRVKAIRLRGIVSQGVCAPCDFMNGDSGWTIHCEDVNEWMFVQPGDDVTEFLGITKWEPPIPVHMAGQVQNLMGWTLKYDVENMKKHPNVLVPGEEVVITEKLHGTWACWGGDSMKGKIVTSKGLSGQGLSFKMGGENEHNLYVKTLEATRSKETGLDVVDEAFRIVNHGKGLLDETKPVYILGEIYGGNVQDLKYGINEPEFRLFDVYVGKPGEGKYLDHDAMCQMAELLGLKTCPVLWVGPYSKATVLEYTDGKETVSGTEANMREGVVVRTMRERSDPTIGRVQLKSVSDAYLLRKNATEFS
jgi:RNA ligase (TIGR02306 family)